MLLKSDARLDRGPFVVPAANKIVVLGLDGILKFCRSKELGAAHENKTVLD